MTSDIQKIKNKAPSDLYGGKLTAALEIIAHRLIERNTSAQ